MQRTKIKINQSAIFNGPAASPCFRKRVIPLHPRVTTITKFAQEPEIPIRAL